MMESESPETMQDYVDKAIKEGFSKLKVQLEESTDIIGFQEQLNAFSNAQKDISLDLVHVRRRIAGLDLRLETFWMTSWMQNYSEGNPLLEGQLRTCEQRVREIGILHHTRIEASDNPHMEYSA
ncbi:MAG: hypothetical protein IH860_06210, partial [Chloroflexi bacterium]|nr:hypothetical protein [Chloroflexota bacterium]